MAVTLAQAAALETNAITRGALEVASQVSNVWDRLPFEPIQGNSYAYDSERILPGTAFRTVNEAYIESTGVVNQASENLVILGGDADVDQFLEKTMGSSRAVLMANQIRMKLASAQATFADAMFNGDVLVQPKGFDGLGKRLVGDQVLVAGAKADEALAAGAEAVGMDDLAEKMIAGDLNYDVVIATPDAMRVVGKLGQVLGPRGLMPNPKVGTVSPNPAEAVRNAKAGQVRYRTDKAGIIHCTIGKASFENDALKGNLQALLLDLIKAKPATSKGTYLQKISVSSTMGPGVTVDQSSLTLK